MLTPTKFPRNNFLWKKKLQLGINFLKEGWIFPRKQLQEKRISLNKQLPQRERDFLDFLREKWTKLP
jgi:hypothetical protein